MCIRDRDHIDNIGVDTEGMNGVGQALAVGIELTQRLAADLPRPRWV